MTEFEFGPQALEIVEQALLSRAQGAQLFLEASDIGLDRTFAGDAIERLLTDAQAVGLPLEELGPRLVRSIARRHGGSDDGNERGQA